MGLGAWRVAGYAGGMTEPVLLVSREGGRATLTLNRPRAMNALSRELRQTLAHTVTELEADPEIRVLVLTGAGRAFCAGLDLKELGDGSTDMRDITSSAPEDDPTVALGRFSGPVVGAINGAAITGGFELALACDVLVGSPGARFADTHARIGIMPGWGLSQKLSRIIGLSRAKELSLTGNFLGAEAAMAWGLLNRVVPADELIAHAEKLADDMLSADPVMLVRINRLIEDGYNMTLKDGLRLEGALYREVNAHLKSESIESRREAVRRRGQEQSE